MRKLALSSIVAATTLTLAGVSNAAVLFDAMTPSVGAGGAPNTGNSFMGQGLITPAFTTPGAGYSSISGLDIALVNNSGAALTLTGLRLNIWTYDGVSTSATISDPQFTNPVAGNPAVVDFTLAAGGLALGNNTFSLVAAAGVTTAAPGTTGGINFTTPIPIDPNSTAIGFVFNWQGATDPAGTVFNTIPGLTTGIRGGAAAPAFAAGTPTGLAPNFGYNRNASGLTTGNLLISDGRQIGLNSSLYIRVYGDVIPEPTSLTLAAAAGAMVLRRKRKA